MTAAIALAGTHTHRGSTTAHTIEIGTTETAITGTIAGTGGIGESIGSGATTGETGAANSHAIHSQAATTASYVHTFYTETLTRRRCVRRGRIYQPCEKKIYPLADRCLGTRGDETEA